MQEPVRALFPEKIYQLAEKWQVGTPLNVYKARTLLPLVNAFFLWIICLTLFLLWNLHSYLTLKALQDHFLLHCDLFRGRSCAARARFRSSIVLLLSPDRSASIFSGDVGGDPVPGMCISLSLFVSMYAVRVC